MSKLHNKYGCMPPKVDVRDFRLAKSTSDESLPVAYIPQKGLPKVKNQGCVSSCVAHTTSSILEFHDIGIGNNTLSTNFIYGIICGMLMYMAVKTWQMTSGNPFYAMLPVAIFILSGFNHCVADMFYLHIGCMSVVDYWVLIPTTIGNIVGCNLIPMALEDS